MYIARFSDALIATGSVDLIQADGRTADEAIANAVSATGADVAIFQASPATEALIAALDADKATPDRGWGWNDAAGAFDERVTYSLFGDGQRQGTVKGFASSPEAAVRKIIGEFGEIASIRSSLDGYHTDTRLNPGLSEYQLYVGDFEDEEDAIAAGALHSEWDVQLAPVGAL